MTANGGPLAGSMQPTTTGVYVPIPMTTGPPPAPYGIFATHPTAAGSHQSPGVGMHPNYMAGPPPQIITHCGLPPPQQTGIPDNMENICNLEMTTNNGGLMSMPPPGIQISCPNYPPPMPFYYSANGVNSIGGSSGGVSAPISASANGVHLVAPFSHQVTPSNQPTTFASPHPSMGTQVIICICCLMHAIVFVVVCMFFFVTVSFLGSHYGIFKLSFVSTHRSMESKRKSVKITVRIY